MRESGEVEAVVRRIWESGIRGDFDTFRNHFSKDPRVRMVGAADEEWWRGHDEVAGVFETRIGEVRPVEVEFQRLEAFESGSSGWAAGEATFITGSGNRVPLRFTCVLELEAGVWRVVQWHASAGVSNVDLWGLELTETLEDLVESLDATNQETLAKVAHSGTVTLMFTDIEDSTSLSSELGDEAWTETIRSHFDLIRLSVERHSGTLIKTLGDGALAGFPGAVAAVSAAIYLQSHLAGSAIRIRIGLHTGEVRHVQGDYVGLAVNKAARVASAADGGEILISSITAELMAHSNFVFGEERTAHLKGLGGGHRLIAIDWQKMTPTA